MTETLAQMIDRLEGLLIECENRQVEEVLADDDFIDAIQVIHELLRQREELLAKLNKALFETGESNDKYNAYDSLYYAVEEALADTSLDKPLPTE